MSRSPVFEKGCGPQPFEASAPSHNTPLDRLTELAVREQEAIADCEHSTTTHYWRLGQVLRLARQKVGRGAWAAYLKGLGIEKTRASKAAAIHRTFSSVEKVTNLSVAEAYERRRKTDRIRKESKSSPTTKSERVVYLPQWITQVADEGERLRDEVAFLTTDEVQTALEGLARGLLLFQRFQTELQQRSVKS